MRRGSRNPEWTKSVLGALLRTEVPNDMCRDKFLQELFDSLTPPEYFTTSDSSIDDLPANRGVQFGSFMQASGTVGSFDLEANLLKKVNIMDSRSRSRSYSMANVKSINIAAGHIDINKLMRDRIGSVANLLGTMAVLYALNNLRSILHTLRHIWHPQTTHDKSLHMFSWSIQNYFDRFNQKKRGYCELFIKQVGDQIECVKYRKDLGEIIRLLDCIIFDVNHKNDICKNSMEAIKDSQTDIFDLLTESKQAARKKLDDVILESLRMPKSADPGKLKLKDLTERSSYNSYVQPIEARYIINWTQTRLDQAEAFDRRKCDEMIKELEWLRHESAESHMAWKASELAFDMQITGLKDRLVEMEMLYEEETAKIDRTIDIWKAKTVKAKEELQFYINEIPIFHKKIEQTLDLIAKREGIEREPSIRKSRKSSRIKRPTK